MANLRSGDVRRTRTAYREQVRDLQAARDRARSTRRTITRGEYAPDSIPPAAQQAVAAPALLSSRVDGLGITTAGVTLLTFDVQVPQRMTRAAIFALARVYAVNGSVTAGTLLARVEVEDPATGRTFIGNALPTPAAAGAATLNPAPVPAELTGLVPGGLVHVRVWAQTSGEDWPANDANRAELSGLVVWWS